jgi:predicted TIM-barrel fold metal-dependent hydrolase
VIDANVSLFRWPFRRVAGDDPPNLVAHLRDKGVTQAWAGSFEALLCRDVAGVNARLAAACRKHGADFLVPFGCVNPQLPDWQEDLRRCCEVYRFPGIRLYPNYHGYSLGDRAPLDLLFRAANQKLLVQIALCLEDTRTQLPPMQVPFTNPTPLAEVVRRIPNLRLLLLNGRDWLRDESSGLRDCAQAGNVYWDIAMVEGVGGIAELISATSADRVLFGSHYPFYYFESALLKVRSAGLPQAQEVALLQGNARMLLSNAASAQLQSDLQHNAQLVV